MNSTTLPTTGLYSVPDSAMSHNYHPSIRSTMTVEGLRSNGNSTNAIRRINDDVIQVLIDTNNIGIEYLLHNEHSGCGLAQAMDQFQNAFHIIRSLCATNAKLCAARRTSTDKSTHASAATATATARHVSSSSPQHATTDCCFPEQDMGHYFCDLGDEGIVFQQALSLEPVLALLQKQLPMQPGCCDHVAASHHDISIMDDPQQTGIFSLASAVVIFNMAICFHRKAVTVFGLARLECLDKAQSLYFHSHLVLFHSPAGTDFRNTQLSLQQHLSSSHFVGLFCLALLNNIAQAGQSLALASVARSHTASHGSATTDTELIATMNVADRYTEELSAAAYFLGQVRRWGHRLHASNCYLSTVTRNTVEQCRQLIVMNIDRMKLQRRQIANAAAAA